MNEPCRVPGCDKPRKSKGYCTGHYERVRRNGDAQPDIPLHNKPKATCSVDGCDRTTKGKGLCETHYMRVRTLGDVHADIPIHGFKGFGEFNVCEVRDCDRTVRSRNSPWCEGHYNRMRKHGDLRAEVPLQEQRSGERCCAADGCTTIIPIGTYCGKHHARMYRHGDPSVVIPIEKRRYPRGPDNPSWTEEPSYYAIHRRVRKLRGKASDYPCVDCTQPAYHWSYTGVEYEGTTPHSADPMDYQPRCVPCHSAYDRDRAGR